MTWLVPSEETCFKERDSLVTLVRGPSSFPSEFSQVPSQHTTILLGLELGPSAAVDSCIFIEFGFRGKRTEGSDSDVCTG